MDLNAAAILQPVLAVALAPLLPGVINRVKAFFAGRRGPPLLQAYFDLGKLFRKGAVYSRTTTWVFRAGPLVNFACLLAALVLVPLGTMPAPVSFAGDLVLLAYLLGLGRFATVAAALDTGSSFEGMGASRETQFAVFAEPALLIGLAALARATQSLSLSAMYAGLPEESALPLRILLGAGFFILFLAENSRIPVDDPNTHLELTMIHEVMVLDHSGPDLAAITYGAALKFVLLGSILLHAALPHGGLPAWLDPPLRIAELAGLAALVGVLESSLARLRLNRVPLLLAGATVLAGLATVLTLMRSVA
jgi:formate hydrogenlyase subunit 4